MLYHLAKAMDVPFERIRELKPFGPGHGLLAPRWVTMRHEPWVRLLRDSDARAREGLCWPRWAGSASMACLNQPDDRSAVIIRSDGLEMVASTR